MNVSNELLKKYNKPGPRYTSYPPATFFTESYSTDDFVNDIIESNNQQPQNISIYIHIPFCPQLCHFCGCTTMLKRENLVARYVAALKNEIIMKAPFLDKNRKITQIHWGGGTPNSIEMGFIKEIMDCLKENFTWDEKCEVAIECSPAYLELEHIDFLAAQGFNRISLGIQDFDPKVLEVINRAEPKHPIEKVIARIRENNFFSVNIDLVYGLPTQTLESFQRNIEKVIKLSPDRLVTFSYAHVPWVKGAQKQLEKYDMPSAEEKMEMLEMSLDKLTNNGYESIGMDHYAKPKDELFIALQEKKLHRNFQGYCTKETTGQVYAFGVSGIDQMEGAYAQNEKNVYRYMEKIEAEEFATIKGYKLTRDDVICRAVINEIMCNGYLNFNSIAKDFQITVEEVKSTVAYSPEKLAELQKDGLVKLTDESVEINEVGLLFVRNIAMAFDPQLNEKNDQYSKTV